MVVVPYDPLWPQEFEAEADRIERACAGLPIQLEHMGSTSVPGLSAKPVIDILAESDASIRDLELGPWDVRVLAE